MPSNQFPQRARRRTVGPFLLAALLGFGAQLSPATLGAAVVSPPAQQWVRWEGSLTGTTSYGANDPTPYRDIKIRVTFQQGSQRFETYAFWRSGNTYSVRAAFPTQTSPGNLWTWTTSCPTPAAGTVNLCATQGLGGKTATVTVNGPGSTSALYTNGMLRAVAPAATTTANNRGYLAYASGVAFPWLGDTAWMAPIRATPTQWTAYVGKLKAAGFTAVQIATPVDYMDGSEGEQPGTIATPVLMPFKCTGSPLQIPDSTCWMKDDYWIRFEDMVKVANDNGIVVVVAGLMERVIEKRAVYPDLTATKTFARTLVSRLAGSHVIFSPAFDHSTTSTNAALDDRIKAIGAEILDASHNGALPGAISVRQPITNHSAGSDLVPDLTKFQNEAWLSFYLFQSGQAAQLAEADADIFNSQVPPPTMPTTPLKEQHRLVFERSAKFPTQLPNKAAINGELIYEGVEAPCPLCPGTNQCTTVKPKKCVNQATYAIYYTAETQRKNLWYSFFNGAAGGTIGVAGTFNWQGNGLASSNSQSFIAVKRMKAFFQAVGTWTELKPTTEGLYSPSPAPSSWQKIYAIQNLGRTKVAIYTPEGAVVALQTVKVPSGASAQWFNPRVDNAALSPASAGSCPTGISSATYKCYTPTTSGTDWILVFLPPSLTGVTMTVSPSEVTLIDDSTAWTLVSQAFDANGDEVGTPIQIADPQVDASPQGPRLAKGVDGGYLAVWEREDPSAGTAVNVVAQRLDATGTPIGSMLALGTSATGSAMSPSLVATPDGGYAVAWWTVDKEGNQVLARKIAADGTLLAEATVATLATMEPAHPIIASDEAGNLAVAWEENDDGKTTTIAVERLDSDAQPVDSPLRPIAAMEDTSTGLSALTYSGGVLGLEWTLIDKDGTTLSTFARGYDSFGEPVGDLRDVWNP